MLSDIPKTFDPLSWLSPVTIFLKQLVQRAWEAKISWDVHLPSELADQYLRWRTKLISLKDVELQRFVLLDGFSDKIELHLFCDASERVFWIPSCRNFVRKKIKNCVKCNRFNSKPVFTLMGDLPKTRVDSPIKAFEDVGLDFAGPFICKKPPNSHKKSYLALFACFASKAIHLELVSDLSTAACIAAIRRFVSRRGCPKNLYSDNGENFVGSEKEIADLQGY